MTDAIPDYPPDDDEMRADAEARESEQEPLLEVRSGPLRIRFQGRPGTLMFTDADGKEHTVRVTARHLRVLCGMIMGALQAERL